MDKSQLHTDVNHLPQSKGSELPSPMSRLDFVEGNLALNQQDQVTDVSRSDEWDSAPGVHTWRFSEPSTEGYGIFSILYSTASGIFPKYKLSHVRPTSLIMAEQHIYPKLQFRSGFLTTDMFYNVPAFIKNWGSTYPSQTNYSMYEEYKRDDSGYNLTETTDYSIISRHPEMTASSGTFVIVAWFGTEWRPIAIENSPAMEYGIARNLYTYTVESSQKVWDGQIYLEPWS